MNKQEAIEKIKNLKGLTILDKTINFDSEMISKKEVLNIVKQLDEPVRQPEPQPLEIEKPVVPQFVANWYEEHKDNFEYSVQCLCVQGCEPARQIDIWFDNDDNKPIETLVKMKLYGYEVEKDKLYTVEIPNPDCTDKGKFVLCKNKSGKVFMKWTCLDDWEFLEEFQLTEEEVKEKFAWAWQFAEVVEE